MAKSNIKSAKEYEQAITKQRTEEKYVLLGLDSWNKAHMSGRGAIFTKPGPGYAITADDEDREFTRYEETWVKAFKRMREDGVLERAVWVAPMNEVPHFTGRDVASFSALLKRLLDESETAPR